MQTLDSNYLIGLLSEAYPGVICYVGPDYKFKFASQQYSHWFGADPASMIGMRNTEQIYHPDIAPDGEVKGFLAIVYDVTDQNSPSDQNRVFG
jgi:hypothetical protein